MGAALLFAAAAADCRSTTTIACEVVIRLSLKHLSNFQPGTIVANFGGIFLASDAACCCLF